MKILEILAAGVLLALTSGCGGGGSGGASQQQGGQQGGQNQQVVPVNASFAGEAITKVRASGAGWLALAEKLHRIEGVTSPERRLLIAADGKNPVAAYAPPAGWSLIDFAVHPSGDISVVQTTDSLVRLLRLNRQGVIVTSTDLLDPAVATDPFYGDPYFIRYPNAMQPLATRDAVRLAGAGEDLVVALRSGRNTVLAYRFGHAPGGYQRHWRTVVEPGAMVGGIGITSGTFDPFYSLDAHWRVTLDVDGGGRVAVGISTYLSETLAAHAEYFNEALDGELPHGLLITELTPAGQRVATTFVNTVVKSEVHALRWSGNTIAFGGRVFSERRADGTGWNAYAGVIRAGSKDLSYRVLDVDKGEIILDLAALPSGRLLASGAKGYWQNPSGGSISEEAQPWLAVLEADGSMRSQIAVAAGPRQHQVRSIAGWNGKWLTGGMQNAPGTHSADGNPALLTADGFVRETKIDE